MGSNRARTWLIATVVLIVLVLIGGWFLAVSPQIAEAGDTREQTRAVEEENEVLRLRNAELRRQFARLDEMRAELAAYQTGIPIGPGITDFLREVDAAAEDADVLVVSVAVSQTQVADTTVTPPVEDEAVEEGAGTEGEATDTDADAEGEATDADAGAAEDEEAAPAAPDGPLLENLYTIPVTITVLGPYPDVRDFLEALQTGLDRTFYVPSLAIVGQEEATGSAGLPDTELGDITLTASGLVFVLSGPPAFPEPEVDPEEQEEPTLPSGTDENWFIPITGDEATADDD